MINHEDVKVSPYLRQKMENGAAAQRADSQTLEDIHDSIEQALSQQRHDGQSG